MTRAEVTGYTIADRNYFIGVVAMLTSLRRQGHHFPVKVLDLGLTAPQRGVLEREFAAHIVERGSLADWHPYLLGPFPHVLEATGVFVYLDADLIVTRPLDELITAAEGGAVCAVTDEYAPDRWCSEWVSALSLRNPLRREPYVNLGCLVFSTAQVPELLGRWAECCAGLASSWTFPMPLSEPLRLGDQDVLNALLMSEVPAERRLTLPPEVQPMSSERLARTRLVDSRTLACTVGDVRTAFLHPADRPKPWQSQHRALRGSGYERCLRELASSSAVPLRVAEPPVPLWLRPGWPGVLWWRVMIVRASARRRLVRIKRAVRDRVR